MAWGALNPKVAERRKTQSLEQARAAWLIASDLSAHAFDADVRVVMQTRGTPGRGGDDKTARARKVACYLALVVGNVQGATLAQANGMDRATIHVHAAWVEDEREKPEFDALVDRLEKTLVAMAVRIVVARMGGNVDLGDAA